MKIKMLYKLIAAAVLTGATVSANAAVIFQDNFDTENGGVGALNYAGFSNWSVSNGTVDLIGNGYFDFLPGNGLYVDLDGSSSNAGVMLNTQNLVDGDYTLSFDLAGNQRNNALEYTTASVSILVGAGQAASSSYMLDRDAGFQTFSLDFSINDILPQSMIGITFGAFGGDNIGMLLDNVILESKDVAAVPEPAGFGILGVGLLSLGLIRRRANKQKII